MLGPVRDDQTQHFDKSQEYIFTDKHVILIKPTLTDNLPIVRMALTEARSTWIFVQGNIQDIRRQINSCNTPHDTYQDFDKKIHYVYQTELNYGIRFRRKSIKNTNLERFLDVIKF